MKNAFFFIFCVFFITSLHAQNKYFEKLYKWNDVQEVQKIILMESGFVLAENSYNFGGDWQALICSANLQGDTTWTKAYGNIYGHIVFSNFININDMFVFTGNMTQSIGGDNVQMILLTYNINSASSNLYNIGSLSANSWGRSIIQSEDVKMLVVGSKDWQPYAVKTDTLGNNIWEQVYDNYPLLNWLTDIIPVPNEPAYYVIGTVGYNIYGADILIAKISDLTGEMLWDTTYNFGAIDAGGRLIRSQFGGYIAGSAMNGIGSIYRGAVLKFDNNFNLTWYNDQLFTNGSAATVSELPDGNIVTSGQSETENDPYGQMNLIKLSGTNGSILWRRTYGGSWNDYAYDLALAPDGGFLVAGRQDTIIPGAPIGHASAWLLKLNCMGLLTQPAAAFSYEPQGANEVQFTNLSLYAYPDSTDGGYYIWDFGDGSPPYLCGQGYAPCTGNTLTHQYPASGSYLVTLTAIVCTDTSTVQALIDTEGAGGTVGTSQNSPSRVLGRSGVVGVVVYPNPAQNTLQFTRPLSEVETVFSLYTLTGQLVLQTQLSPGEASKTISVAHLPAGLYVCKWQQAAGGASGYIKVAVVR